MKKIEKGNMKKNIIIMVLVLLLLVLCTGVMAAIFILKQENTKTNKANVSWYSEDEEVFTIKTAQELYDLAELSNFYDFKGQTIELGADIVVNEGNAADWATKAPEKMWFPIQGFAGTFDGKGHTISGVYGLGIDMPMGMFSDTNSKSVIRDFKLVNSYFCIDGSQGVGSIASNGSGSFDSIYTDAIVTGNRNYVGGFIGRIDSGKESSVMAKQTKITNCWFDGEVRLTSNYSKMAGGFVGALTNGTVKMEHCLSSGSVICSDTSEKNDYRAGGFYGAVGDDTKENVKATLTMDDCLHVGTIETPEPDSARVGNMIGFLLKGATGNIENSYAEKTKFIACGALAGELTDYSFELGRTFLTDKEAYRWTDLDFKKYWSIVENETPELTYFSQNPASIEGLEKAYNVEWYDAEESEYVLYTVADLYGFSKLCNQGITFAEKNIKLGNDIVVNEGKATDWMQGKNVPTLEWVPIGGGGTSFTYAPFSGTFDGQGYTVSGLYIKSPGDYLGFFGLLDKEGNATLKNFRISNSYFECTRTTKNYLETNGLGSIVGQGAGTLDTIYSDAILKNGTSNTGGLVGGVRHAGVTLTVRNCWYDGSVTGTSFMGGMVGFMHSEPKGLIMKDCLVTADITSTLTTGYSYVGGLAGRATSGNYDGCVVTGELTGVGGLDGGLIGLAVGEPAILRNCYNATNLKDLYKGIEPGDISHVKNVSIDDLKGIRAYTRTLLDFYIKGISKDGNWVIVKDSLVGLRSFTKSKTLTGSSAFAGLKRPFAEDTTWYTEKKKEFVITTPEQLYGLAKLCNKGVTFAGKTVKLGKDIVVNDGSAADWAKGGMAPSNDWTPIGSGDKAAIPVFRPFSGTFDGQGHTISGLYAKSDSYYIGLFGVLDEKGTAVLKNFKLKNSYFEYTSTVNQAKEYNGVGSIVGQGAGTLDTIYSDAILTNGARSTGGLVGCVRHTGATLTVKNCWYDGTITGTQFLGGIVGFMNSDKDTTNKVVMKDCLVTADITTTLTTGFKYIGGLAGRAMSGTYEGCVATGTLTGACGLSGGLIALAVGDPAVLRNCYNATNLKELYKGIEPSDTSHVKNVSIDDLKGVRAYTRTLLGFYIKGVSENGNWVAVKDETVGLRSFTENNALTDSSAYAGLKRPIVEDTTWYDAAKKEFVITTAGQLYGLAKLCNKGVTFAGKTVKLGKDIVVNEGNAADWAKGGMAPSNDWTPIGSGDKAAVPVFKPFSGTFDGQGHTISGLYAKSDSYYIGLFGVLGKEGTAVLKNFKLTNSYFEYTGTVNQVKEYNGVGSIVGQGAGTLDTIYSDAILKNGARSTGGLVGCVRHTGATLTVKNCWYDGTITGTQFLGGIVGFMNSDKDTTNKVVMKDCLVTADIITTLTTGFKYIGGLAGRAMSGTYEGCVVTGTLTGACGLSGGLIALAVGEPATIKNCYNATNLTALYKGIEPSETSHVKNVSIDDLKGVRAYTRTLLDFYIKGSSKDGKWVAVKDNGFIGLQSFTQEDMFEDVNGLSRPIIEDTTWYDETKNEFVITTAKQLYGLATLCNKGVNFAGKTVKLAADIHLNPGWTPVVDKNGVLTNNIVSNEWNPIGKNGNANTQFNGTFDGQGYAIRGLYVNATTRDAGLFGYTGTKAQIKNIRMYDSYINAKDQSFAGAIAGVFCGTLLENIYVDESVTVVGATAVGGICGALFPGATREVSKCWFDGNAYASNLILGGLAGYIVGGTNTISDCLFTGTVTSTKADGSNASAGGLIGENITAGTKVIDCLSMGTICVNSRYQVNAVCALSTSTDITFTNVYTTNEISYAADKVYKFDVTYGTEVSRDAIKVNAKTALPGLYDAANETEKVWVLDADGMPILNILIIEDTTWYDAAKNEFVITTSRQLYGLAKLCNEGVTFAGKTVKLAADIHLNAGWTPVVDKNGVLTNNAPSNEWNPIGKNSNANTQFNGTFDGQGYAIRGLYVNATTRDAGLFGYTGTKAQIKNIRMYDSYINAKEQSFAGAIAGVFCGTLLENIYVDESVTVVGATAVGGICGALFPGATREVSKCWFDGKAYSSNLILGGIAGYIVGGSNTISDCLFTGTVTSTKADGSNASAGGLIGENITAGTKVTDCLSMGTICVNTRFQVNAICALSTSPDITFTNVYTTNEISFTVDKAYKFDVTYGTEVSRNAIKANAKTALPGLYDTANETEKVWILDADGMPSLNILLDKIGSIFTMRWLFHPE